MSLETIRNWSAVVTVRINCAGWVGDHCCRLSMPGFRGLGLTRDNFVEGKRRRFGFAV